ncbi:MAG: GspE/PulE family protein [Desulfitobacteriaceae bacterium]
MDGLALPRITPLIMKKSWGFGQYLIDQAYIMEKDLQVGLQAARENGERIGEVLVRLGFLSKEQLQEALSNFLRVPRISLTEVTLDQAAVQVVSEELAKRYTLIPVSLRGGTLRVAMADPTSVKAIEDIRLLSGYDVEPLLAQEEEIQAAIRQFLTMHQSVAQLVTLEEYGAEGGEVWSAGSVEQSGQDAPTVRLVDSIIQQAVNLGASDIHWEPRERDFLVRFRIDGQLNATHPLPSSVARSVLARLKMMAKMDVAERRLPQDGRIVFELSGRRIDLRVSSLPTVYGEKGVVRILDSLTAQRPLSSLGMRRDVEEGMRLLLQRPHGMILLTGPTGSGKTTTLYSLVRELRTEQLNIVSIEDPVEYRLPGVNQVQVQTKVGLTFAKGLRAILRQDPDVIMIGEIRDQETARIAVSAALTGHLVLTTLHTNTAAEAITRLIDMGIEPYLLIDAVNGVLSQRLVRLLCDACKGPTEGGEVERAMVRLAGKFTFNPGQVIYQARGCQQCRGIGYKGRIGIHELLRYNQSIKELVLTKHSSREIEQAAVRDGMLPLIEDGLAKVGQGLTTIEEVLLVAAGIEQGGLPNLK